MSNRNLPRTSGNRLIWSLVIALGLSLGATNATAGPYDFDDDERRDMQSAWLMCATTAFTVGECPSIFTKCWRPPMIYLSCKRGRCKVKTHCIKFPSWNTSDGAVQDALAYAEANQPEAVAYEDGGASEDFEMTPQICLDYPELCPTLEEEAAFDAADAALDACLENPEAECTVFDPPLDGDPGTPAICLDNPGLCDDIEIVDADEEEEEDEGEAPEFTHPICEDNPELCDDIVADLE